MLCVLVTFSVRAEFARELVRLSSEVVGGVVRITTGWRRQGGVPYSYVSLVATFRTQDQLVQLDENMGEDWGPESRVSKETHAALQEARESLEKVIQSLNFTVAGGRMSLS